MTYFESSRRYGAIKGQRQLIKEGLSVSLKRVHRLMKSAGLASIIQKKYISPINNLRNLF